MFEFHSTLDGRNAPQEYYLGTAAEAYAYGELLVLTTGGLTKCAATAVPEFVCMGTQAAENPVVTPIPVMRIMESDVFKTVFSADGSSIVVGDLLTIDSDGLRVTATTSSGVFKVKSFPKATKTAGKPVVGMFRR